MELTGKNIIAGRSSSMGNTHFRGVDPVTTTEIEPLFYDASMEEVDEAIVQAASAFDVYRRKSGIEKSNFLHTIAEEILINEEDLIKRAALETALGEGRIKNELARTIHQIKLFAEILKEGSWVNARIDLATADLSKTDIRSMQRPIGPVGIFGASNFPLAFSVAGGDTISALAAGCCVVFKAHPAHPGTSEIVGMAIVRAVKNQGLPVGVFSMVHGNGPKVGMHIVEHDLIKAIGFTGSFTGGKALFDAAAKRPSPIPVYAEMSSTNPVFILPGALKSNSENIGKQLAASVTLGSGQFCTNPGLVFLIGDGNEQPFIKQIKDEIVNKLPSVMLSAGIGAAYRSGVDRLLKAPGVSLLVNGVNNTGTAAGLPYVFESNVSSFLNHPELENEVFGPSTILLKSDEKQELLIAAEKLSGHLTATVIGDDNDLDEYAELISILEKKAGRVIINGYPTGVQVCHSMVHGGPFPATTDSRTTSIGTMAIYRFTRPVCYQNFPDRLLPDELKNNNPSGLWRMIDGVLTNEKDTR